MAGSGTDAGAAVTAGAGKERVVEAMLLTLHEARTEGEWVTAHRPPRAEPASKHPGRSPRVVEQPIRGVA